MRMQARLVAKEVGGPEGGTEGAACVAAEAQQGRIDSGSLRGAVLGRLGIAPHSEAPCWAAQRREARDGQREGAAEGLRGPLAFDPDAAAHLGNGRTEFQPTAKECVRKGRPSLAERVEDVDAQRVPLLPHGHERFGSMRRMQSPLDEIQSPLDEIQIVPSMTMRSRPVITPHQPPVCPHHRHGALECTFNLKPARRQRARLSRCSERLSPDTEALRKRCSEQLSTP